MTHRLDTLLHLVRGRTRDLAKLCGGVARLGEVTGYSQSQAGRWVSQGDGDVIPLMALVKAQEDAEDFGILRALAAHHGLVLVEAAAEPEGGTVFARALSVSRAMAELAGEAAKAAEDGVCTLGEATRLDRIAAEAEQELARLRKACAAVKAAAHAGRVVAMRD